MKFLQHSSADKPQKFIYLDAITGAGEEAELNLSKTAAAQLDELRGELEAGITVTERGIYGTLAGRAQLAAAIVNGLDDNINAGIVHQDVVMRLNDEGNIVFEKPGAEVAESAEAETDAAAEGLAHFDKKMIEIQSGDSLLRKLAEVFPAEKIDTINTTIAEKFDINTSNVWVGDKFMFTYPENGALDVRITYHGKDLGTETLEAAVVTGTINLEEDAPVVTGQLKLP